MPPTIVNSEFSPATWTSIESFFCKGEIKIKVDHDEWLEGVEITEPLQVIDAGIAKYFLRSRFGDGDCWVESGRFATDMNSQGGTEFEGLVWGFTFWLRSDNYRTCSIAWDLAEHPIILKFISQAVYDIN
ncbi:unnamed protein product [Blepharisma stoltei]|uniref:Uncharacterized protein n=1 Tax=Blepharisma stoltei TaxID=1481888 RepID=A0AAU9IN04_9CILI|nr:unnamed protein product [Blepharisma stoltei]